MRSILLLSSVAATFVLAACESREYSYSEFESCYPVSVPLGIPPGCSPEKHREGEWASYARTTITQYTDSDCYVSEKGAGEMGFGYDPRRFVSEGEPGRDLAAWSRGYENSEDDFGGEADFGVYVNRHENAQTLRPDGGNFRVTVVFRPGQLTNDFARDLNFGPRTVSFQFDGSDPLVADTSVPFEFNDIGKNLSFHNTGFEDKLMTYLFVEAQPTSRLKVSLNQPNRGETYVGEIDFRGAREAFWAAHRSLESLLERGCAR